MEDDLSYEWCWLLNSRTRPIEIDVWVFNDNGVEKDAGTSDGDTLVFNAG